MLKEGMIEYVSRIRDAELILVDIKIERKIKKDVFSLYIIFIYTKAKIVFFYEKIEMKVQILRLSKF